MKKNMIGFLVSALLTLGGLLLRWNAQAIAWAGVEQAYTPPRSETDWGHQETAIGQVGLLLAGIGGLMLVVSYAHWLFSKDTDNKKALESAD